VQCFFGFVNFYCIFIIIYSQVVASLTWLTCKDKLDWGLLAEKAFLDLKMPFTTVLIFIHPDFTKAFYLEIHALDFALGAIPSQVGKDIKNFIQLWLLFEVFHGQD